MFLEILGTHEDRLVTLSTQALTPRNQELVSAGMRFMTRRALSSRHWGVDNGEARAGPDAGVTLSTEVVLSCHQERLPPRSMGIVTGNAFVFCRWMNQGPTGFRRILVTLEAYRPACLVQEFLVARLVPTVTGRALLGHLVGEGSGDRRRDVVVALSA
jgi:hypothetical protein